MSRAVLAIGVLVTAFIALPSSRAFAVPVTVIDFESLGELGSVTTQFPGITFSNATVLTAGSLLNEIEFPPESGQNVVTDDGGPMSISFASPIASFGGFFTYLEPLTLTAVDASHNPISPVTSAFLSNLAVSGDAGSVPNEFLQLGSPLGIASVTITGDPFGGSFVLDNATFTALGPTPVPEPGTLFLLGLGGALLGIRRYQRVTG